MGSLNCVGFRDNCKSLWAGFDEIFLYVAPAFHGTQYPASQAACCLWPCIVKCYFGTVICALLLAGCSSQKDPSSDENRGATVCVEPENPYSQGTGHYAGYEWAERNGGSCAASSQSFNEGCEEYDTQEEDYEECQGKATK